MLIGPTARVIDARVLAATGAPPPPRSSRFHGQAVAHRPAPFASIGETTGRARSAAGAGGRPRGPTGRARSARLTRADAPSAPARATFCPRPSVRTCRRCARCRRVPGEVTAPSTVLEREGATLLNWGLVRTATSMRARSADQTPRARQRRVVRRRLGHVQVQESPQAQRIRDPPRNPPLRRQTLEVADEQQPEIPPRTQTRAAQPRRVEHRAQPLHKGIESGLLQNPVQPFEKGMSRARRKVRCGHPHRRRLSRRRLLAHCHAAKSTPLRRPQVVSDL